MQDPGYLQLENVPVSSSTEADGDLESLLRHSEHVSDEAVAWQPAGMHLYSYSIAYQPSYFVPVLLFQGRHPGIYLCHCPSNNAKLLTQAPFTGMWTVNVHHSEEQNLEE